MNRTCQSTRFAISWLIVLACVVVAAAKPKDTLRSREEYLARVEQQQTLAAESTTPGSLWVSGGRLTDLTSDYKAVHLNDTVVIEVVQQTTAQATGDTETQRQYTGSSAITSLPGKLNTNSLNFGANSSTALKGTGTTSSS